MHITSLVCYKMSTKCPSEGSSNCVTKRKKTRRGKKWRNVEGRRQLIIDAYMKQRKHRAAPSNTTQFLMEDREEVEPILCLSPTTSLSSRSSLETERNEELEFENLRLVDEDHFDEQFFVKDFEATYRQLYRENLYTLSKPELLERVKKLERQRDVLENEWRCCSSRAKRHPDKISSDSLTREFKQLQEQNDLLRQENNVLRKTKEEEKNTAGAVC